MMLGGALAAATIESCVAAIARTREVFVVDTPPGNPASVRRAGQSGETSKRPDSGSGHSC
ncbi:hypothetical protein A0W34_32265 (plasmid) [Rhodococcus sp. BH4]|nr:hypothetical protein A0W34_32265 [Rhodococcus sp. BH4]